MNYWEKINEPAKEADQIPSEPQLTFSNTGGMFSFKYKECATSINSRLVHLETTVCSLYQSLKELREFVLKHTEYPDK